jgi:hypothetical protein
MSDPWSSVAPSIVASIATTLVTLGITKGVGTIAARSKTKESPLLIRRRANQQWSVTNRTKKAMVNLSFNIVQPDGMFPDPTKTYSPTSLMAKEEAFWGVFSDVALNLDGYSVTISWTELKRQTAGDYGSVEIRIKPDVDEYQPKREKPYAGG